MRKSSIARCLIFLVFSTLFSASALGTEEQTIGVPTEQQPAAQVPPREQDKSEKPKPSPSAEAPPANSNDIAKSEADGAKRNSEEDGSEFWTVFSHRLKITDTILAVFTGLLFVATVFLYCATRDLAIGADKTAKRQLRAYVHISFVSAHRFANGPEPKIELKIKNFGQTPARQINITFKCNARKMDDKDFTLTNAKTFRMDDLAPSQPSGLIVPANDWFSTMHKEVTARSKSLWVYGRIDYVDVFEDAWYTEFRTILIFGRQITDHESFVVIDHEGNHSA